MLFWLIPGFAFSNFVKENTIRKYKNNGERFCKMVSIIAPKVSLFVHPLSIEVNSSSANRCYWSFVALSVSVGIRIPSQLSKNIDSRPPYGHCLRNYGNCR
eukprot:GILK01028825.1.p1 GENE.GILK01028825.1~~GILK01028825.1.p1  ORF type:complete len:101 (-),score=3.46 GILK01028825.1:233-535(-)